jgi:preprotein translocase subunit SecA
MAQITFQRFFPRYLRLSGTSGTLHEARHELQGDYKLATRSVPLRRPNRRRDLGTVVCTSARSKWERVIERVCTVHQQGRPVLIGTSSVADSEKLSALLHAKSIAHQVLNARQDHAEARIISQAGARGAVTVATNMAGRGTDIVLREGTADLGGLHIISCQLNAEARIDRQLHGRAARQGDPGSVETVLCLDEPVLEKWIPRWLRARIASFAKDDQSLPNWMVKWVVRLPQWLEEFARRQQRRDLIRRDALNDRRLSFSGPGE